MPRLRRNEWNFAHTAAALITEILSSPQYSHSPLGHAEPELTELRGARRLDLVIFHRQDRLEPLVTAETKVPWAADGRTPYGARLVESAHGKASRAGALYFITWNVRRVVVWKTDDPGVALLRRAVFDREISLDRFTKLTSPSDLDSAEVLGSLRTLVSELVSFLHSLVTGPPLPSFLPLDKLFIANIEAALDFPIEVTTQAIKARMDESTATRREVERWMRDVQGWVIARTTEADNIERASRFSCYVLVNRLCFYNALRRKYEALPRLTVANNINTAERLRERLRRAFRDAERSTRDYETVFEGDFGDNLPFFADEATPAWRDLIRSLDHYDFAHIGLDVIGAMYEQLIKPSERHRFGQHYTQPTVVDLIGSFAIQNGNEQLLDPACGGGTFLVRAYARKTYRDPLLDHSQLLESIYGCDILNYACHLSTINLAIRDLIDDDNYPRIHLGDFLRYVPGQTFSTQPVRLQSGGLITETRDIAIQNGQFDAVIGNPPYIQSREMSSEDRDYYHNSVLSQWPDHTWRRASDIYCYFWTHSAALLRPGGHLGLLTQAAWLDVDYGIPLQEWMLDNFRIVAILETEAEPWFTGARVATAVTLLVREEDSTQRESNTVRFLQFRRRLSDIVGEHATETDRQLAIEELRNTLLRHRSDMATSDYRIRLVPQAELRQVGEENGHYVGSKWGRYLRSTDTLYKLQRQYSQRFVALDQLARIQRGTTTNADSFFLVKSVSDEALTSGLSAREFRDRYGVARNQVASGAITILRRRDGVELALETSYLRPILKTARDYSWYTTAHVGSEDFAVFIAEDREHISRLALAYIQAGERERWHQAASFQGIGSNWYTLRDGGAPAPILFVKTMQYTPVVLLNDAQLLANQRLYNVCPHDNVSALALCAVMNSTIFICERYAAVKALGREAAIDVEVFSAKAFRTPDIRTFDNDIVERLIRAMQRLDDKECGSFLEEGLLHAGHSEALGFIQRHEGDSEVWPLELHDETRQEIDRLVLAGIGVPQEEIVRTQHRIYDELTLYIRKLRLLELEAQINRRGNSTSSDPTPRQLADDIWAHLIETDTVQPRMVPGDFLAETPTQGDLFLPSGNFVIAAPSLFEEQRISARIGRAHLVFDSIQKLQYVAFLAEIGVTGDIAIPLNDDDCDRLRSEIGEYVEGINEHLLSAAAEITAVVEFQRRIQREGIRRIIQK